ncbi:response regulator [Candidatus Woesearchaeota archaeon]|nr:response regulator [Candidatus Woesearchaeota archaeon]
MEKKLILIVDDNKDIRYVLKKTFEKNGYKVETATDGQDMIDKLTKIRPELIILDVMMPGLKTHDILEKIKEFEFYDWLKIIVFSALDFSEEQIGELKNIKPVKEYTKKPFEKEKLLKLVKETIENG